MITPTSLKSAVFLARVKEAAVIAVKSAKCYPLPDDGTGKPRETKIGFAEVKAKRTGKVSLLVAFRRGSGLEFFDSSDRDITGQVLAALRDYHAELRQPVKPIYNVDGVSSALVGYVADTQDVKFSRATHALELRV